MTTEEAELTAMQQYINTVRAQIKELMPMHPDFAKHLAELLARYCTDQSVTVGMHLEGEVLIAPRNQVEGVAFIAKLAPILYYHRLACVVSGTGVRLVSVGVDPEIEA